jgi:hypothetical protein
MDHSTRVARCPQRARPRPARTAAAIIATATLAVLVAACGSGSSRPSAGSGGSPAVGRSAGSPSAIAYSACMRSHGVPNFPDPTNGGSGGPVFNITRAGISDAASHASQFEAKLTECGRLAGANAPESFE